jgi:nucleoside-diphosphate-sugar epimerase
METEIPRQDVVLMTGADGLLGTAIGRALAKDYRVVGLNRTCDRRDEHCIPLDLTSQESVDSAFATVRERCGSRIASVIHLAAYFDFTGEPNPLYETVNVEGTRRLLSALRPLDVEQFVYASTMLVYAPTEPGKPLTEDAPLAPKWAYPQSKRAAEEVLLAEHGEVPVVLLRIAGVYTDECQSPVLAHQIQRIYERTLASHLLPGDPTRGQAMAHLDDVAGAFRAAVERHAALPAVATILIGEPETLSYDAIQDQVGALLHGTDQWHTRTIPKPVAKAGAWLQDKLEEVIPDIIDKGQKPFIRPFMVDLADDHYELDISRARQLLGWEPRHRLGNCLSAIAASLKADPEAWYRRNKLTPE